MARPVSVSIPHNLGKAEARKRIETGFGQMRQNMLGGAAGMMAKMITLTDRWEGDQLQFEGSGMGQKLTGRLDVREDAVQIQIDLPDMLAAIADKITGTLKTEGQKLINAPAGCGVAVNSQYLYWSTESPRAIGRAGLDGSSPDFEFIAGGASASGIALDSLSAPPLVGLGKAHLNARLGTATIGVHIALGGQLRLTGKGVRNFSRNKPNPGTYVLAVTPVGSKKHKLEETGKAKVKLSVNFRPIGGAPQPELERTLTLRLRG